MRRALNVARKFLFPTNFLRIRHEDNKYFYVLFPVLGALAILVIDVFISRVLLMDLIKGIQGLLGILAGFYIASLAAVATFNKPSMDEKMLGAAPVLPEGMFGVKETVELTRREYLCLLFGYLASASILIYVLTVVTSAVYGSAAASLPWEGSEYETGRRIFMVLYLFAVFNLLSVTLLGIYFLSHGIHRESYKVRKAEEASKEGD